MMITSDLKRRLSPEFIAHLVAQLKSTSRRVPLATRTGKSTRRFAILEAPFVANSASYGRMRMAALQT